MYTQIGVSFRAVPRSALCSQLSGALRAWCLWIQPQSSSRLPCTAPLHGSPAQLPCVAQLLTLPWVQAYQLSPFKQPSARGRGRPQCPVVLGMAALAPCPAHHCPAQVLRRARAQPRAMGPCTSHRAAGALGRGGQSPSAHTVPSCRSLRASDRDKDFNGNNRKQLLSSDRGSLNYRRHVKNEIT